jgi:catechol 2,3-dioxygenase-like lactoylglutathione lyase family enzyme
MAGRPCARKGSIMKLNHLDLQVSDVPRTVTLFEELLGLRLESNRGSNALAILTDGEGFTLVVQRRKDEGGGYPDGFHFGFLVSDVEDVRRFHAAARARDLHVSDILENNRGTLVYWRSADGYLVEVSCHRARKTITGRTSPGGVQS